MCLCVCGAGKAVGAEMTLQHTPTAQGAQEESPNPTGNSWGLNPPTVSWASKRGRWIKLLPTFKKRAPFFTLHSPSIFLHLLVIFPDWYRLKRPWQKFSCPCRNFWLSSSLPSLLWVLPNRVFYPRAFFSLPINNFCHQNHFQEVRALC